MLDPLGLFCLLWLQAHLAVWEIVVLLQYNRCLSEMARKKQKQQCVCVKGGKFILKNPTHIYGVKH